MFDRVIFVSIAYFDSRLHIFIAACAEVYDFGFLTLCHGLR